jgi:glycosyltransferase involved in cell wall biosynthesis
LLALLTGGDYWQLKMLTPGVRDAVAKCAGAEFDALFINFLYSVPLLSAFRGRRGRLVVDTHNYDPELFAGFASASRNPITYLLCRRAIDNSRQTLAALPIGTTLVHVSESDAAAYRRDRPDLTHVVVENGCRLVPRTSVPDYDRPGKKQLLFVGSLSTQMNQDALRYLARRFWPLIRDLANLKVIGSSPSAAAISLCATHGWHLCPNLADEELEREYTAAHYAIAPFPYGAGSKLKLMEACGHGVPVLTTSAGVTGVVRPPPCVHVSDEPDGWKRILQRGCPPTEQEVRETLRFAEHVSWPRLGTRLARVIAESPIIEIPRQMPWEQNCPRPFGRSVRVQLRRAFPNRTTHTHGCSGGS